ncbi:MAG TPA: excinuclease ABC subunit C [Candidatus Angelobacter sp.]|nr:excinuclease ABC subunit C [Candidatus Angelobacter sp.]
MTGVQELLTHSIPFSIDHAADFFAQFAAAPAVFALRGADESAEPYVSKTANLRKRLLRLLAPPESQSKRLNLRERTVAIEYSLTGSDFESVLLLYQTLREEFPREYPKRLRLRPAPLVRLNLENEYPRAYVTTRIGKTIGKLSGRSLYYGPFRSRVVAEKFLNDSLDLFKMRRCTFDLNPDPTFPGCVYSEMKMCLAPCFKGCTDEAYSAEVARVQEYFDSGGQSLLRELEAERERLSATLDFEGAAAQHARVAKIKNILSVCDDICGRLDRLNAVVVQPSVQARCVALFCFHGGQLTGPVQLAMETEAERQDTTEQTQQAQHLPLSPSEPESAPAIASALTHTQSMEGRIRAALESLAPGNQSIQRFSEELSILKRWFYRSHKVGEVFFAGEDGEMPWRKIVRGVGRVYRGEKEGAAFEHTENKPEAVQ